MCNSQQISQKWLACHLVTFFILLHKLSKKVAKWQANHFCEICWLLHIKFIVLLVYILKKVAILLIVWFVCVPNSSSWFVDYAYTASDQLYTFSSQVHC